MVIVVVVVEVIVCLFVVFVVVVVLNLGRISTYDVRVFDNLTIKKLLIYLSI